MVGRVRTEELNINALESGVVAVLETKHGLNIVTLNHITKDGEWVVMGKSFDYTVTPEDKLCKLVVLTDTEVYPLKYNQWANAIRNKEVNSETPVTFELVSPKFKEGKYVCTCSECTAQFLGTKNQPTCKVCCEKDKTARILITKSVKPKRPRMVTTQQAKTLAENAWQRGRKNEMTLDEFHTWLNKQF